VQLDIVSFGRVTCLQEAESSIPYGHNLLFNSKDPITDVKLSSVQLSVIHC
jgi:hypothetical protein